jgi:hypothetical protein
MMILKQEPGSSACISIVVPAVCAFFDRSGDGTRMLRFAQHTDNTDEHGY